MQEIWALKLPEGKWYPPDHFLLDDAIMRNSRNAKPFYGKDGKFYANLFKKIRPGSEVVPHPHPEMWR